MGPCLKSYLSYKFDRSETARDRAKMNLAGHPVRRLFGNYFEPCLVVHHPGVLNQFQNLGSQESETISESQTSKRLDLGVGQVLYDLSLKGYQSGK